MSFHEDFFFFKVGLRFSRPVLCSTSIKHCSLGTPSSSECWVVSGFFGCCGFGGRRGRSDSVTQEVLTGDTPASLPAAVSLHQGLFLASPSPSFLPLPPPPDHHHPARSHFEEKGKLHKHTDTHTHIHIDIYSRHTHKKSGSHILVKWLAL